MEAGKEAMTAEAPAAPAAIQVTKTESERKREMFELGLGRGEVVVRFDVRRGCVGITLDEKEEPHRAAAKFTKARSLLSEAGIVMASAEGEEPLEANLIPWEAVWAVEGKGPEACGFFPKSCPSEHTQALFMQCMSLRQANVNLGSAISSALAMVDREAPHGQWRRWREAVQAMMGGGKKEQPRIVTP